MLKFRVISDIHLEFHKNVKYVSKIFENDVNIDYLILAGDICTLNCMPKFKELYDEIHNKYKKIFYVLGNHEFYKTNISETHELIRTTTNYYKNFVKDFDKIVLLDNDVYKTEEGINIAGCTLWSNPSIGVFHRLADQYAVDYSDYIDEHKNSMKFLENLKDVDIIITHHCPNPELVDKKYANSPLNSGFYTDCSKVYNKLNGVFFYGHTHSPIDTVVGNVRFVCNPYGYPNENKGDKNKILNICASRN